MKTIVSLFAASALLVVSSFYAAAQSGQKRDVSDFNAISSNGSFNVQVKLGGTESVKVEADDEVINDIETVVENHTLKIRWKERDEWQHNNAHKANVYVTARELSALANNGSGDITVEGAVAAEHVSAVVNGSGNITASVKSGHLSAAIHGSGSINISGEASDASIMVSGSGQVNGKSLKTTNTAVTISGSGNVYVSADQEITSTIAGSGNVTYSGSATATSRTVGSGRVRKTDN